MKFISIKKLFFVVSLFIATGSVAQYCNDFHRSYCDRSENDFFKYNGQSRSALFAKGQTSELSIVLYKGQDYRISFCVHEDLGGQVEFQVVDLVEREVEEVKVETEMQEEYDEYGELTGKMVEVENKYTVKKTIEEEEVLFDNSKNDMVQEVEFSAQSTRRVLLKVTLPGESGATDKNASKKKLMRKDEMGCIGVLIEHMSTPKQGF